MMGQRAAHDESRQVIRRLNHFQSGQTFWLAECIVASLDYVSPIEFELSLTNQTA